MQLFDLYYLFIWIILLILLQIIIFLSFYPRFGHVALPISFSGSILIFSLISWYITILGLSLNYTLFVFTLLGILGIVLNYANHRSQVENWHQYYIVFFYCFAVFLLARILSPNILGEEKFMDFAYIHSLYRYPVIPPVDIWYSGEPFTVYYYYGYWIFASLGSLLKIPPQILFNLALPTIAAFTAVNLYGIGTLFSKRYSFITLSLVFFPTIGLIWLLISGYSLLDAYNGSFHIINGEFGHSFNAGE
ncbi:MAG: hypothetical protein CVV33_00300 [Methanomicrobiales archaeon HGW-Methanomicrobiales-4]|nr:MAG: hypothetical protein CVV33_00300 [Methanomicrobiales archaeon HGW-Methanomicrobiales-4]